MLRPRLLAAAVCAAGLTLLPADAHAAKEVDYDITFQASGTFGDLRHLPPSGEDASDWTHQTQVGVSVTGSLRRVTFRDGRLTGAVTGDSRPRVTATSKITIVRPKDTDQETCTATPTGEGAFASIDTPLLTPLDGSEALLIRLADDLPAAWACEGDPLSSQEGVLGVPVDAGEGPLDVEFRLPREAIGAGKIIQNLTVPGPDAPLRCPSDDARSVTGCQGGWSGQVTFVKTAERTVADASAGSSGDELLAPLVRRPAASPASQPARTPAPAPADPRSGADDDLLAPLVLPKKASVDAAGRKVSFRASCTGGCAGTATFTTAGARAAAARPLAAVRFRLKAGAARTVRLTLPAKARRALRRTRQLRMTVALKAAGGATKRATLTVRRPG